MNTSIFRNHCCNIFCTIVILLIILVKTLISVSTVWLCLLIRFFRVMPFSPLLRRFSSRLLAPPFPVYDTLNFFVTLHKMRFLVKLYFSKCEQIRRKSAYFSLFNKEILNRQFRFLCIVSRIPSLVYALYIY